MGSIFSYLSEILLRIKSQNRENKTRARLPLNSEALMNLIHLSDQQLHCDTKSLASEERRVQLELLHHLLELDRRKLFLSLGFGSLFDYVVKELKYSESSAYRRIQAMRLLRDLPQVEEKLAEGSLTLTAASQLQSLFKKEDIADDIKLELVKEAENKSSRDVERQILQFQGATSQPQEKIKQVSAEMVELKLTIPTELKDKLDQLRLQFSHVNPEMSYIALLEHLCDKALPKVKPQSSATAAPEVKVEPQGRHIPAAMKREVWERDDGCCSYKDANTGKRCGSKFQLQYDHIEPYALGGRTELENLRILCAQHNRRRSTKTYARPG
jgi:hypothetical protein